MWGSGDALVSSSAMDATVRRNRPVGRTQSFSVTALRTTVLLDHGLRCWNDRPWQRIGRLSHNPRGIFLARDLKTKQESLKMRFIGAKVECSNETLKSQPAEGQQVRARNKRPGRGGAKPFSQGTGREEQQVTAAAGTCLPAAQRGSEVNWSCSSGSITVTSETTARGWGRAHSQNATLGGGDACT